MPKLILATAALLARRRRAQRGALRDPRSGGHPPPAGHPCPRGALRSGAPGADQPALKGKAPAGKGHPRRPSHRTGAEPLAELPSGWVLSSSLGGGHRTLGRAAARPAPAVRGGAPRARS